MDENKENLIKSTKKKMVQSIHVFSDLGIKFSLVILSVQI
jgi:hypothetical protein